MTDLRQAAQQALEALEFIPESGSMLGAQAEAQRLASITTLLAALAESEQQAESVGEVIDERGEVDYISYVPPVGTALYTTQPKRQWVGLTDEDFLEACQIAERGNYLLAFQRIQIKLKEKNT